MTQGVPGKTLNLPTWPCPPLPAPPAVSIVGPRTASAKAKVQLRPQRRSGERHSVLQGAAVSTQHPGTLDRTHLAQVAADWDAFAA